MKSSENGSKSTIKKQDTFGQVSEISPLLPKFQSRFDTMKLDNRSQGSIDISLSMYHTKEAEFKSSVQSIAPSDYAPNNDYKMNVKG